jgi:hypothetical protein
MSDKIAKEFFMMKNTIKLLGIIVLLSMIGFSMAACNDDSSSLAGTTWKGAGVVNGETATFTIKFSDSTKFQQIMGPISTGASFTISGTYTFNGSSGTMTSPEMTPNSWSFTVDGNKLTSRNVTYTKQ